MSSRGGALAIIGIGVAGTMMLLVAGHFGGLRVNLTPSYPLGIWRIAPLERAVSIGDLIFVCPPTNAAFALALEHGYVRRGLCPGGFGPLIKMVAATAGQHIAIAGSVSVDGQPIESSALRRTDAEGRAMPSFSGGVVPPGHLYLHSDYARSYDSRYFGPISGDGILGLALPLLTTAP